VGGRRFGADLFLLRDVITATTIYVNTEHDYSLLERVYRESPASGAARKTAINSLALVRYCTPMDRSLMPTQMPIRPSVSFFHKYK